MRVYSSDIALEEFLAHVPRERVLPERILIRKALRWDTYDAETDRLLKQIHAIHNQIGTAA